MTEIYYVQNEKQYRQLLARLTIEKDIGPDELSEIGICGCNYNRGEDEIHYWACCDDDCETEECCFSLHINDVDIADHMAIEEIEVEFPLILVLTDSCLCDEKVILVSVKEAKENTKYGYRHDNCWGAQ